MDKDQKMRVMMTVSDKVDGQSAMIISNKLDTTDEKASSALMMTKLYDKMIVILLSIFLGGFGVDRFYLKDYGIGVLKIVLAVVSWILIFAGFFITPILVVIGYLLLFGTGIFLLVDIFLCYKAVGKKNFNNIMNVLNMYPESEHKVETIDKASEIFN